MSEREVNQCVLIFSEPQVKFMKRIAAMSDLTHALQALPRIQKLVFNPDNMRWAPVSAADGWVVSIIAASVDIYV